MCGKKRNPDWRPGVGLDVLRLRAKVLSEIRHFFSQRGVLEVETPILAAGTNPDPNIESFTAEYIGPEAPQGCQLYLQSSPEFAMKRLLCAGSGPIYQISKAFRQGEFGTLHNPEFTILEWYRPDFGVLELIKEIESLVLRLFSISNLELSETQIITYQNAFQTTVKLDPLNVPTDDLINFVQQHGFSVHGLSRDDRDSWLDIVMSYCVQPYLGQGRMTFVTNYPVSQASLAKVDSLDDRTAERFEFFINGIELGNGFHELNDSVEQKIRFEKDLQIRASRNQTLLNIDEYLLSALEAGLPDCCGIAIGMDRVIMLLLEAKALSNAISFPYDRA